MIKRNRYDTSGIIEAQFEQGSRGRVLKNLLGIKGKREMDEAESVALKITLDKLLGKYNAHHRFTAADIRTIHKIWLGEIYEWAGKYRQVNVSKGNFLFAAARHIPSLMAEFEKNTLHKHTPCNFKSMERIIQALAESMPNLFLFIHSVKATAGSFEYSRLLWHFRQDYRC